ncbi:uncharacterized mitochondrial protein-like protein [Tanacetum coccineum]
MSPMNLHLFCRRSFSLFIVSVHRLHEPESYREAVCDPLWQVAMAEKLVALHQTQIWYLVPLPVGKRAIGSRWVYKIKTKSDGSIERYKASLVAKGYAQEYGMDYEETFAPVTKMTIVSSRYSVPSPFFPSTSALDVHAYCDSDWAGDVVSRKLTTGFCIFLGDSPISWKSKKQDVLSKYSTEVEYRAMIVTTTEIVWLSWLLADMGVRISRSTPLHCDNRNAIQIARNSMFHERSKHIEIDCHFTLISDFPKLMASKG